MEKKSFKDFGIDIETSVNDEVSLGTENEKQERASMLLFPKYGVTPELDDQLEAVFTDPSEMLRSLRESNIVIEEIPKDEREKFGLEPHPLHAEHLKQVA